jgi:hypothetical protein
MYGYHTGVDLALVSSLLDPKIKVEKVGNPVDQRLGSNEWRRKVNGLLSFCKISLYIYHTERSSFNYKGCWLRKTFSIAYC